MSIKRQAITGIKWTTLSGITTLIISIIQLSILSRFLEKEALGLLSILMIILGFSEIIRDLGISNSIIHFKDVTIRQLNTLYWINITVAVFIAISLFFIAPKISVFYEIPILVSIIKPIGGIVLISAFGQQFQYLFYKKLQFELLAKIEITRNTVVFFVILYFLILKNLGILSVVYGMLAGAIVYSTILCYRGFCDFYTPNGKDFSIQESKPFLSFGAYQLGERFVNYFSSHLDKILIGHFYGLIILGAYELAYRLALRPFTFINPIFNQVSLPIFSKIQEDYKLLNQWYLKKIETITFLTFPAYIGLLVLSEEMVNLLYGIGWELTVDTFNILGFFGIFWTLGNPIGSYLLALGKPQYGFWMNVYRFFIYGGTFYCGGLYLEYTQTLWCYLIVGVCTMVPLEYYVRFRLTKMRIMDHLEAFTGNLALACLMGGIVYTVKNNFFTGIQHPIFVILLCGLSGIICYLILCWIFKKEFLLFLFQQLRSDT